MRVARSESGPGGLEITLTTGLRPFSRLFVQRAGKPDRSRLEAVGDQLRADVDGAFVAEARDASLGTARLGVATNRAAASFFDADTRQP